MIYTVTPNSWVLPSPNTVYQWPAFLNRITRHRLPSTRKRSGRKKWLPFKHAQCQRQPTLADTWSWCVLYYASTDTWSWCCQYLSISRNGLFWKFCKSQCKQSGGKQIWSHFLDKIDKNWVMLDLWVWLRNELKLKVIVAGTEFHSHPIALSSVPRNKNHWGFKIMGAEKFTRHI
jgi:hypothetical protein